MWGLHHVSVTVLGTRYVCLVVCMSSLIVHLVRDSVYITYHSCIIYYVIPSILRVCERVCAYIIIYISSILRVRERYLQVFNTFQRGLGLGLKGLGRDRDYGAETSGQRDQGGERDQERRE